MRSDAAEVAVQIGSFGRFKELAVAYIQLTKPRIVLLFAMTGLSAIMVEGSMLADPLRLAVVLVGIVLTAASANALNQFWDRDIDAIMTRTRTKRPLPTGKVSAAGALGFGLFTGGAAALVLFHFGNVLALGWALFTIVFYVGVYTMWLKRRTPQNIVIGGVAGATAPLIAWAAATGTVGVTPALMFLIVFLWTPPHFWALALCVKEEYEKAGVPMLPVVAGDRKTTTQMLVYTVLLVPVSIGLGIYASLGWMYNISALFLSAWFVKSAIQVRKNADRKLAWNMFIFSIAYLFALYLAILAAGLAGSSSAWASEKGASAKGGAPMSVPLTEQKPFELRETGLTERLGAQVDLGLPLRDENGEVAPLGSFLDKEKPTMLLLVYYGCPNICGFLLNGMTDALRKLQWTTGEQFNIVTVSIDPSETPELAAKKKETYLRQYGRRVDQSAWRFLVNDKPGAAGSTDRNLSVAKLAQSVGFEYRYDKRQKQYAHPAVAMILTPQAKVSRVLHGIDFAPRDLRFALLEAGGGKIGSVVDHVLLFCYHYDPVSRKYALYATNLMRLGGGLTAVVLGAVLLGFWRKNTRETA